MKKRDLTKYYYGHMNPQPTFLDKHGKKVGAAICAMSAIFMVAVMILSLFMVAVMILSFMLIAPTAIEGMTDHSSPDGRYVLQGHEPVNGYGGGVDGKGRLVWK